MARLAKDYETYKSKLNVTFVGINTSASANETKLRAQIKENNLLPFATVWDATGSIAASYSVPTHVPISYVIVDAEGKIALNVKWSSFYGTKEKPLYAYIKALDESLAKAKGVLGDIKVPAGCERAAHLFSLQQFDQMDAALATVSTTPETKAFKEALKAKVADYTAQCVPEFTTLAKTNPLAAYRETSAFLKAFGKSKEASAVQKLNSNLANDPKVKKELEAEAAYQQVIAPPLAKALTMVAYNKSVQPLMDGYLQRYGDTEYGQAMKALADETKKKLP